MRVLSRAGRRRALGLWSGWLPRLAVGLAAAGAAAAVVLAVILVAVQHRLDNAQAQNHAIAAVLAAPDARVLTRPTSVGGSATVVCPGPSAS